jgi:uncharacterized membrane protein YeiH
MASAPLLAGFDPALLLVLNLVGTFVFGLSGGMAGVRKQLDLFGAIVLAVVVGIAGGTIRDVLIGIPPQTFRDWRYLAVAAGAGLLTAVAHPAINRLGRPIDALDAAGLALFCVTGAATALAHRLGVVDAVILGAITGIGGGMLRDVLVGEIPTVLRAAFTLFLRWSERGSWSWPTTPGPARSCFRSSVRRFASWCAWPVCTTDSDSRAPPTWR